MKLKMTCTRAEANHKQLQNCLETLDKMKGSFQKITKLLSLAGNDVRLKILYLLNKENELCPCDLADILKMSVPAVSQHIRKMKDAAIITSRRDGQTLYYSLNEDETEILNNIFKSIRLERKTAKTLQQ
ncbi:metalloregulator ArsR/SmtB family transcription factor [Croceibacter atlanticus]|uniref:ArsR/SmtB family transcription factor n=1 Tax=Croceibacter atlanticus TaxID=313588 RepID=UPI001C5DEF5B|nr:metalloregulator ArsR/SmtB family transcription factor [Croceibacter atlanticus]MBW4971274.1 metalloregulator ArsR/SmtB family transcription factor [Croceibacter atlanticus]